MQDKQTQFFLPFNAQATEAHRILWNGVYFSLESAFVFEKQIQTLEDARYYLGNACIQFTLTRFEDQFRAKMLGALKWSGGSGEGQNLAAEKISLDASVNVFEKKLIHIPDEFQSLIPALEKLIKGALAPHLIHPFCCFFPELLDDKNLKNELCKLKKQKKLVPFQSVFPFCGTIEAEIKGCDFILDDLYCTNPQCDCNEVTCVVLSFDPKSGQETTHGGFKYHLQKKSFKMLADFPKNFNAQEWFKKFSQGHFVDLGILFRYRYGFLRVGVG